MKENKYTSNLPNIYIPQSNSTSAWMEFLDSLELFDYFAPLYAIIAYLGILSDREVLMPPSFYDSLYYDLGIEMCADDRYPAYDAAMGTGFMQRGLTMLIVNAQKDIVFVPAVEALFKDVRHLLKYLPDDICTAGRELLDLPVSSVPCDEAANATDYEWWCKRLQSEMLADCCASQSILAFFLANAAGQEGRIYCPLGWVPYEKLGKRLAEEPEALAAAIDCGLMAAAIPTYFYGATDNYCNWSVMNVGVRYILNHPQLKVFAPGRDKYIAEKLLHKEKDGVIDEALWEDIVAKSREDMDDNAYRGY